MYISSLHYNTDGRGKRAVCTYNHFIITRNDKSFGMYISSLYYKKEGQIEVALCIYHHFIITSNDKQKLRYVYIIPSL